MKLNEVLKNITPIKIVGNDNVEITGVNIDSRRIKAGHLFVAIRGTQVDGHQFIDKAIELGADAVLCEELPEKLSDHVTYVQVESTEDAVGKVATLFYGNPSHKLKLVGVTGTNGKTTIATLLYNMFRKFGYKVGLLSTVCNYIDDVEVPADHTTPDPIELNELLAKMVEAGCEYAFMECSSHAIHQKRIGGLKFAGGLFTNLTRDHLDYHKTFENYRNAKKAFFDGLPKDAFAITNADDKNGMIMVQNTKATVKTYSIRSMADFRARILECHFEGMYLEIDGREVGVQFIGKFNVSNLLAVYGAAIMLGKKPEDILLVLSTLHSVSGRLEPIHSPEGFTAIVDYAHTPDALANVLNAIHEVLDGKGHVITVCGAGGNRDKGKRPLMAQEAVRQSDKVIITSDNPRFEDPQEIINEMLAGLNEQQMRKVISIVDRKEAIRTACMMAQKGDVVLVAGKGHENYQEIKGVKHHFDDKEVLHEIFKA
ncbi:MAG: UDP-N-acetylmuramoyl-L-alanyl-D-glutamate--2,6-diaminopimelate ligase [Prevotella salivae]|jgi:UDP-N-acetylmuramoyl-L-alanyl-D-glutamate--2,6-diaminopimelate ligase|uniref:UDP-N-acetylmuramoyl-L-alanyl-D-glutamate--2,6-diaminopimelate ligase n=1 Tax=Segatella salivae DSM 15606 TaxID=888832 RepID=E6MPK9_9BACT|nr:UDP-N-acetylmuramoyl-L-alanyl-D-glutamate--2,6-diaminopimelate ligase [Segatella salivae]EFV04454.1 UDP-N-acetylmuramoyl-L-alanyl-D-glutamate--2,6-diaminopimelate ligase [Segatella salivae DSM 15606]MBF1531882.1 UDP-N-acetylmuramoyl-L-alanyl-D-glutamate--2,6-diaminopimelate ligase [Segatella salivae]MBF1547720.1 UDP-N-acetylmuramoyl-L-alanyl-D-glutamate--2,6-diaminopimelate ligase [Segatella salivae]MBF1550412.1 UDP-N-acetylmuramoyl-L-alanyl-D-glutamate--2,6-diaminopimelate ligase [Segatella